MATQHIQTLKTAIRTIRPGDLSQRELADIIASLMEANGVVGPQQRSDVLDAAAREFAAGDQVPGGSY